MKSEMQLTVLGARGSVPAGGAEKSVFGGSTSCYMLQACGQTVFLDAGSGLVSAPAVHGNVPVILLTHLHLDHVLGLGMYPRLSEPGTQTRVLLGNGSAGSAASQLSALFAPPFWPLKLTEYGGGISFAPLPETFEVGGILIDTMEGRHPGGCRIIRAACGGKSLVYATDYEPDEASFAALVSFSRGADLLLYDAQYTPEEAARRRGFGHSTAEKGVELLERSGAERLLLIHHDPHAADEELLRRERQIERENVRYAREGEVIGL